MRRFKAVVLGLVATLSSSVLAGETSNGKDSSQTGVGGKIEALGNKLRGGADKAVGATTRALKHAGKKTAEGLDKAGNKTSEVLHKGTGK